MTQSRALARLLTAFGAAVAAMALLAPGASAQTPLPGYEQFDGCPTPAENLVTTVCLRTEVTGGHLQMGSKDVPIKNPLTLSGGVNEEFAAFASSPKGGLTPVKQEVPGGIVGLTGLDWLVNFLGVEALKVYAVAELAGTPDGFSFSTVTLPLKVHLINPVLGTKCYIGSSSNPIVLNLTSGTTSPPPPNEPISGKTGTISVDEKQIVHVDDAVFVDNAFAAPGANGCTLNLLGFLPISLNGLINLQSGLPSPAGTNEAVQEYDLQLVARSAVYP